MATLSKTTSNFRKILIIGGVVIIGAIVFRWFQVNPPGEVIPAAVADYKLGQLPKITLKSLALTAGSKPSFKLETLDGKLPTTLPKVVNVYKYLKFEPTLSSKSEAVIIAKNLGFTSNSEDIGTRELKWTSADNTKVLTIDKINKSILLTTDRNKPNSMPTAKTFLLDTKVYENTLYEYLSSRQLLNKNYSSFITTSETLKVNLSKKFEKLTTTEGATVLRVNIYKQIPLIPYKTTSKASDSEIKAIIEKSMPTSVISDNPKVSNALAYVSNQLDAGPYYLKLANYVFDENQVGTYDLISPEEAWNTVQEGKGILTYLKLKENKEDTDYIPLSDYTPLNVLSFTVKNISLAYYEPKNTQPDYLLPVYVFTGEANVQGGKPADFYYYVPAIKY